MKKQESNERSTLFADIMNLPELVVCIVSTIFN
jgi:hypothetical protein